MYDIYHNILLRLSLLNITGNYYNQGELRSRELRESCKVLGVEENHVQILDDRLFFYQSEIFFAIDLLDSIQSEVNFMQLWLTAITLIFIPT